MRQVDDQTAFKKLLKQFAPDATLVRTWTLAGGVSAQVTALELQHADGSHQKVVVRRHGAIDLERNPAIAVDEFRLLRILKAAGIPVPTPLFVEERAAAFATPALVIEFIDDTSDPQQIAPQQSSQQIAATLARIHTIDPQHYDLRYLPEQSANLMEKMLTQPDQPDETLREMLVRAALIEIGIPHQTNPSVLLHGDFWEGNLLWRSEKLVAVVDWEDAARGDPLADLAHLRMETMLLHGSERMEQITHDYLTAMPALELSNLPCWELFAALQPMGRLALWAGDPQTEQRMRQRHHHFVDRILAQMR